MSQESKSDKKTGGCAKIGLWIFATIVGLAFVGALFGDPQENSDNDLAAADAARLEATGQQSQGSAPAMQEEPVFISKWQEFDRKDELRGTTDKFAIIDSNNSVDFDFPYCCDSTLKITVRQTSQYGKDVIFQISDGQFVCGIYDCAGMISFDGAPERLSLNTSADHDSKVLFAKYPDAIIRKLKNSEKVIIELPFYQEGNRQFTFDTKGLRFE